MGRQQCGLSNCRETGACRRHLREYQRYCFRFEGIGLLQTLANRAAESFERRSLTQTNQDQFTNAAAQPGRDRAVRLTLKLHFGNDLSQGWLTFEQHSRDIRGAAHHQAFTRPLTEICCCEFKLEGGHLHVDHRFALQFTIDHCDIARRCYWQQPGI